MSRTWILPLILSLFSQVLAQSSTTSLSGRVVDETGAIIVGAGITLLNPATGFFRETTTNVEGTFSFPFLSSGTYNVTITQPGFAVVEIRNLILNVNDPRSILIRLKVRGITDTIVIYADTSVRDTSSVSTIIDRNLVERLPMNGQSFQSLITLAPGAVGATSTAGITPGQFSFNGQRPTSNYFMVDGVSANIQAGSATLYQQAFTGALPGLNIFGGFNNLVSLEALQEINILTSAYAPEFGRTPGAQISIVTRAGTSQFHGSLFEYLRNDALDSDDWFVTHAVYPKRPLRHNDFGGALGGPISLPKLFHSKRSFFFFSYEGLQLRQPQYTSTTEVPSLTLRSSASAQAKPFLDAFPIPNGPDVVIPQTQDAPFAEFSSSYSAPSRADTIAIRIDHTVNNRLALFGRFNDSPSQHVTRSLSSLDKTEINTGTATFGGTLVITPKISNDFRVNYSRTQVRGSYSSDDFGGAVPLPDSLLFRGSSTRNNSQISVQVEYPQVTGQETTYYASEVTVAGPATAQLQRQQNLVDTFSIAAGDHQIKLGFDYRRMAPVYRPAPENQLLDITIDNLQEIGTAEATVSSSSPYSGAEPLFTNYSFFAQDTWKAGRDLTLTYGLRWELNPPPSVNGGSLPAGVISFYDIATVDTIFLPALGNVSLKKASYSNFAPRFGISYRIAGAPNHETILRGGIGVFYDLGAGYTTYGTYRGEGGNSDNGFPIGSPYKWGITYNQNQTTNFLGIIDPEFKLPVTLRWSIGLEKSLGEHQSISATYVAALGRRLPNLAAVRDPNQFYPEYGVLKNEGSSDYHSLQLQYRRRLTRGLQILANHTWSHSIDLGSQDFQLGLERGSSDFDIRHVFSAAATYDLPALNFDSKIFKSKIFQSISHNQVFPKSLKINPGFVQSIQYIFRNWSIDSIVRWQSALPFNPLASQLGAWVPGPYGEMLIQDIRPDLVYGMPIYIKDSSAPGGRRVNPDAFSPPPYLSGALAQYSTGVFRQGTLGRNVLRVYPFQQIDFTFHRRFNIKENLALLFRADIFNLFNHSNFNNPEGELYNIPELQSTNNLTPNLSFGRATSTVAGAPGNINTLYQIGGPRSIQLSLKLEF